MEFASTWRRASAPTPRSRSCSGSVRVVIVPVINIDGYDASRADARAWPTTSPATGRRSRLARGGGPAARWPTGARTATADPRPGHAPCELQYGVDPNRNYGQRLGRPGRGLRPTRQGYRGTGPWSEPETQAVHEFSQKHDVTSLITMHNVRRRSCCARRACTLRAAPDEDALKELGDDMADDTGYTSEFG